MIEYVLGFYFSPDFKDVALIRKNRPSEQAGKLNGIGGKIEAGENPGAAMAREFREEAGQHVNIRDWFPFAQLKGSGFLVHCFTASGLFDIETKTDEPVFIVPFAMATDQRETVDNLPWLVPMAIHYMRERYNSHPFAFTFARILYP